MKLKHIVTKEIKIANFNDTISSLIDTMKKNKISSVVVINENSHPIGLVSETDIVKIVASNQNIKSTKIKDMVGDKKLFTQDKNTDIYQAFEVMQNLGHRHIVVTDEEGSIYGVATQSDFLKYLDSELLTKLKVIRDVMIQNVVTIHTKDTLIDCASIMISNSISSLVVMNENNQPIGIVTERDMVKYANNQFGEILIQDVISKVLHTLTPENLLYDAMVMMSEFHIRRVVIVDSNNFLVGLITRSDILKAIRSKKIEILTSNLIQKNFELEIIKKQDEELKLLGIALKSSPDGIIITDIDAKIKWCNQAFEELTGYSKFEILGKKPKELLYSGIQTSEFYKALWETILAKQSFKGEIKNKRKDGTIYDEKLTITPLIDDIGEISHFIAVKEDVTERNEMLYTINQIAHFDTLTSLPNKFSLMNEINQTILRANRNKSNVALLIVGLDNFKDINESFGHTTGDELLVLISKFIKRYVRQSDFIARITGDEFAILVENSDALGDIALMADKFIGAMGRTWELSNGASVYLGCTIGISTYPEISKNANELFQYSDAALFLAKKETKGKYRFYNDNITQKARSNIETISNLKSSIAKNEFIVVYQPQIDINTNKIIGAEALVRWVLNGDIVSPLDFIPLAEERGLISGITDFVLNQTCKDLQEFVKITKLDSFKVSINISSVELSNATVNKVRDVLLRHNVSKNNFGIEITESIFINDINNAVRILNRFKDDDLLISMDDFGTGYSSLNYLKQLPIDILKIDKSFVDGLPDDKNDIQISKAIISMAKTLGLKTLAEGVETNEQLKFLQNEGCDFYQGYYFSKPIVKDEFLRILKDI